MGKALIDELYEALKNLHDEQVEYIEKNNLGLPHQNQVMQRALIALMLYREHQIRQAPKTPQDQGGGGIASQGRF